VIRSVSVFVSSSFLCIYYSLGWMGRGGCFYASVWSTDIRDGRSQNIQNGTFLFYTFVHIG